MPQPDRAVTFRVRFHPAHFPEDLARARRDGRRIATDARERLEHDGIESSLLSPCRGEARDGTDLAGLVKLYLPIPYGEWGLVLEAAKDTQGLYLLVVAFGDRHPDRRPSVYDVAHRRRHGDWPPGMS